MRSDNVRRIFRRTNQNVRTNVLSTVVAVLVSMICLVVLAFWLLLYRSVDLLVPGWILESKAVVYLQPQSTARDVEAVTKVLREWSKVREVRTVSQDQARKELEAQLGDWKGVLQGLPQNPLPPSIEIVFKGRGDLTDEFQQLQEKLKEFPQVDEILGGRARMDRIQSLAGAVKSVAPWFPALLALVAALAISNSVRHSLAARTDELELCELLGATQFFSRMPFYLQGVLQGTVGGLMAVLVITASLLAAKAFLPPTLATVFSLKTWEMAALGMAVLTFGSALGWLGTSLSMRHLTRGDVPS